MRCTDYVGVGVPVQGADVVHARCKRARAELFTVAERFKCDH